MPNSVMEKLNKDSTDLDIQDAISAEIEYQMSKGKDQKQSAAMAYSMARERTGKQLMSQQ